MRHGRRAAVAVDDARPQVPKRSKRSISATRRLKRTGPPPKRARVSSRRPTDATRGRLVGYWWRKSQFELLRFFELHPEFSILLLTWFCGAGAKYCSIKMSSAKMTFLLSGFQTRSLFFFAACVFELTAPPTPPAPPPDRRIAAHGRFSYSINNESHPPRLVHCPGETNQRRRRWIPLRPLDRRPETPSPRMG